MKWLVLLLWSFAGASHAVLREEVTQIPVEVMDRIGRVVSHEITVTIFRDDTRPKSAFLILNHGRAGDAQRRVNLGRSRYADNAAYFVGQGFAVFVPTRIGYGVTGGPDVEDGGLCNARDFPSGFAATAAQSLAVITYAKAQSYVDATAGVLAGQSYGGATTVALAGKNIEGVRAAINFAGGSGGNPTGRPENPCSPQLLEKTYADYGRSARTPMLWLYSENDKYWGRSYPRQWFEGFIRAGGIGEFVQLPASGRDGHSSFTANPVAWKPHVERFLQSNGFLR